MRLFSKRQAACALGLALSASTDLQGQRPISPPPSDSLRVASARRLLAANGAVEMMIAGIRANLPAQRAAMPQLPDDFWTQFEARMVSDAPQLVDSIAVLYARTFTDAELAALSEFHRSPAGQRLRDVLPTLLTESTVIGRRWGARIGAEIGASLAPK